MILSAVASSVLNWIFATMFSRYLEFFRNKSYSESKWLLKYAFDIVSRVDAQFFSLLLCLGLSNAKDRTKCLLFLIAILCESLTVAGWRDRLFAGKSNSTRRKMRELCNQVCPIYFSKWMLWSSWNFSMASRRTSKIFFKYDSKHTALIKRETTGMCDKFIRFTPMRY